MWYIYTLYSIYTTKSRVKYSTCRYVDSAGNAAAAAAGPCMYVCMPALLQPPVVYIGGVCRVLTLLLLQPLHTRPPPDFHISLHRYIYSSQEHVHIFFYSFFLLSLLLRHVIGDRTPLCPINDVDTQPFSLFIYLFLIFFLKF